MRNYDLKNPIHMARYIARERYAWPGGYELCGIMNDGFLLCSHCIRDNYRTVLYSTKKDISDGWKIINITNESELERGFCSHCGKKLGHWEIYTEEIHTQRLIEILERDDTCVCCPAAPNFHGGASPSILWDTENGERPCNVCKGFLDLDWRMFECPCVKLGEEDAIKLTYEKLKEKGYM